MKYDLIQWLGYVLFMVGNLGSSPVPSVIFVSITWEVKRGKLVILCAY